jgi:hypothetical protein
VVPGDGALPLGPVVTLCERGAPPAAARDVLDRALTERGLTLASGGDDADLELRLEPGCGLAREAYALEVRADGAGVLAARADGLRHGARTLAQWIALAPRADGGGLALGHVRIEDEPDLAVRGVMLDVSRDRVPTLASLLERIERLAALKVNQLQLYTEHTFAYAGHETVWEHASPLTPGEVRALDERCAELGIELVPNQNCFGHLHRWLRHAPYRALAECPDGIRHPFSPEPEPYGLCPTDPRSLELVEELLDQLLPCFRSGLFHAGLDETIDLGLGRSAAECERRGAGRVYLDFLRAVAERVAARGKRMVFWGDIVLEHPELSCELPPDVVPVAWGYESDDPLAERARAFREAGLAPWLAPGTSSWNSVGGRLANMLGNLGSAARAARDERADGLLVCDWGDRGHLQPPAVSWPGLLVGAACAWRADDMDRSWARDLPVLLDEYAYGGDGAGAAAVELALAGEVTGVHVPNASPLFLLLQPWDEGLKHELLEGLTHSGLDAAGARVEAAREHLAGAPDPAGAELTWVADLLEVAVELGRARVDRSAPPASAIEGLRAATDAHGEVWKLSSREGGRSDSRSRLERTLAHLGA